MCGFSRCWSEVLPVEEKELGHQRPHVREPATGCRGCPGLGQPRETPVSPAVLGGRQPWETPVSPAVLGGHQPWERREGDAESHPENPHPPLVQLRTHTPCSPEAAGPEPMESRPRRDAITGLNVRPKRKQIQTPTARREDMCSR